LASRTIVSFSVRILQSRAIAWAVSRRRPTAAARVRAQVRSCGFVVDRVVLGQVFSEYFGFPCQFSFHRLLIHHHLSSGASTVGQLVADVPSGLSVTPPQETNKMGGLICRPITATVLVQMLRLSCKLVTDRNKAFGS
jgi:hypothetical protein